MTPAGFPHSDISGSQVVCASPELIAAYHVLHRLLAPRHPPCALSSLTGKNDVSLVLGESVKRSLAIRESEDPKIDNARYPIRSLQLSKIKPRDLPREGAANHVRGSFGGDNRDRTGNLRLAKPALSQLSYIPESSFRPTPLPKRPVLHSAKAAWWAWVELNYRPHAYQACALTT
jgi:hypothetical protein